MNKPILQLDERGFAVQPPMSQMFAYIAGQKAEL
jgi:hypothetical protein